MNAELTIERLFQTLVTGDRIQARAILDEIETDGVTAEELAHDVLWPTLEMINQLFRADQLTMLAHHYAARLLRSVIEQTQLRYEQRARRGRKVLMFCGMTETDEMAGLLASDLLEADGYEVFFGGGGIAKDEIQEEVGAIRPDVLLMFGSAPTDAPGIRQIIDDLRTNNACPDMQIVVGGGVFNRAHGLAEEIGADLWATTPAELLECMDAEPQRRATDEQRTVGRHRRVGSQAA